MTETRKDFDARVDSIVRTTVSELRQLLAGYYADDGRGNIWHIDLPTYVPEFVKAG